jgi:hypothetical protein
MRGPEHLGDALEAEVLAEAGSVVVELVREGHDSEGEPERGPGRRGLEPRGEIEPVAVEPEPELVLDLVTFVDGLPGLDVGAEIVAFDKPLEASPLPASSSQAPLPRRSDVAAARDYERAVQSRRAA